MIPSDSAPTLACPLLSVSGLRRPGLASTTLAVEAGQCIVVSGASGSGKTLLLRAIADLDPNEGEVRLNGRSRDTFAAPAWRQQVAYAPAESGWWSDRVGDHVPAIERIAPLLSTVGLPAEALDWPVARLSSGERQRLALVRVLAPGPRVLLLDEPTSALDPTSVMQVEALLRDARARGSGIVVVSHDPHQIGRIADIHLRMRQGRLAGSGSAADAA